MKAAFYEDSQRIRLGECAPAAPRAGQAQIRVSYCGICGTDIKKIEHGFIDPPLILGHECAGVIESGPRKGQRVAIDPAIPCSRCEFCQEGNPNLCSALRFAGHAPDRRST